MPRKIFNPNEWLNKESQDQTQIESKNAKSTRTPRVATPSPLGRDGVGTLIDHIEQNSLDLTQNYTDWLNIAFAFADEFAESGRLLFHRVSQFHPNYNHNQCDKQYTNCLKSKGHGITIKTFFYIAKSAGIDISEIKKATLRTQNQKQKHTPNKQNISTPTSPSPLERGLGGEVLNTKEPEGSQPTPQPFAPFRLSGENDPEADSPMPTADSPTFPNSIFPNLPLFLQKVVTVAKSHEERDILLLGAIGVISACLPKVSGIYDDKRVYPNLYIFITARASAGKGRLTHCRQIVKPIHTEFRDQVKRNKQIYEAELSEYNHNKSKETNIEKPTRPPEKMLFLPANNSATGAYQLLGDSDGRGLIFETEGDTLATAFKTDYGNYSDGFRKAFHHETISYYRRTDREFVDIETPCLSAVLSGTPKQVATLIPSPENGLFSRFIFYYMNVKPIWKNVFASTTQNGLDDYFNSLGEQFYTLYKNIMNSPPKQFTLTQTQQDQFNTFFNQIQEKYLNLKGWEYIATIRRLGIITFRITMILTTLRLLDNQETQPTSNPENNHSEATKNSRLASPSPSGRGLGGGDCDLVCSSLDFSTALEMVSILVRHASKVFNELPLEDPTPAHQTLREKFLSELPKQFNRQKYLQVAATLNIPAKSSDKMIVSFLKTGLVHRYSKDNYINTSIEDAEINPQTTNNQET